MRALTLVLANRTDDDDDGDGYTEAQENILGTNPLDGSSTLTFSPTRTATNRLALNFTCVEASRYRSLVQIFNGDRNAFLSYLGLEASHLPDMNACRALASCQSMLPKRASSCAAPKRRPLWMGP